MNDKVTYRVVIACILYMVIVPFTGILYPPGGGNAQWGYTAIYLISFAFTIFEGGRLASNKYYQNKSPKE